MRTNILRHVAVALGLCAITAQVNAADYTPVAKWSNFNNHKTQQKAQGLYRTVGDKQAAAQTAIQSAANAVAGGTPTLQSAAQTLTGAPGCAPCANGAAGGMVGGGHGGGVTYGGGGYGGGAAYGGGYGGGAAYGNGGYGGMTYGGANYGGAAAYGTGATYGGAVHGGAVHGGAMNGGIVNGGAIYGGAANGAAVNGAAVNGAVNGAAVNGGGMANGSSTKGGIVNGGAINGGAISGGAINGAYGGTIGSTIQGGTAQQGSILSDRVIAESAPVTVGSTLLPSAPIGQAPIVYSQAPAVTYGAPVYSAPSYGTIGQAVSRGNAGYGPIAPWFGGVNLLFLSVDGGDRNRALLVDDATGGRQLSVRDLDPTDTVGFDVHVGRYLAGGCYGIDFGFFSFNPGAVERLIVPAAAGDFRPTIQAFRTATVPIGNVYDLYNDAPEAVGYRARRDLQFTGFEVNLFSFGRMGARRLGAACNAGIGGGRGLGHKFGHGGGRYGGFGGALTRAGNRVQVRTSHGIRYFRLEDEFELAANINGIDGYQLDDIYYNIDVDNTLVGYQYGSQLAYCFTPRLLGLVGGKVGIYGNQVDYRQRLGTGNDIAYLSAPGVDDIATSESDTVLSFLGELNLGLGYRLNNAWTVTGGYRILGVSGVATAPGSIANDFTSVVTGNDLVADDSLILHGGYVGLQYNW